jgi:hypothetical protein
MYLGSRILAGLATLTLAGAAAGAAVPTADAATTACGSSCVALVSQEWGAGYVSSVAGLDARGRHVILAAAGAYPAEDFQLEYVAPVALLYTDGIVGSAVGTTWPSDDAYEYQYTPDGNDTGLCLGTAATAVNGTGIGLETCGVNASTLWITLSGDYAHGYEPLINGTDTNATTPYVLTAGAVGDTLTTQELYQVGDAIAPAQMWRNRSGVL